MVIDVHRPGERVLRYVVGGELEGVVFARVAHRLTNHCPVIWVKADPDRVGTPPRISHCPVATGECHSECHPDVVVVLVPARARSHNELRVGIIRGSVRILRRDSEVALGTRRGSRGIAGTHFEVLRRFDDRVHTEIQKGISRTVGTTLHHSLVEGFSEFSG